MPSLYSLSRCIEHHCPPNCFQSFNLFKFSRGPLHGLLYDIGSDFDEIQSGHPELVESLVSLRPKSTNSRGQRSILAEANGPSDGSDNRDEASRQTAHLIEQIQKQSRFCRFRISPLQQEITETASKGPPVIINVSSD
jgi:hypothetical protein